MSERAGARAAARDPSGPGQAIRDGLIITWRNLKRVPRIPELAIFAILQSIMFVLLFAFVFGGAIPLPGGGSYREFLMPGIFAQTIVFAAATTTIGMTDDVNKGIIDRFRSLPMARSGVLIGRGLSDVVYNGELWGNPNPFASSSFPSQEPVPRHPGLGRRDHCHLRNPERSPLPLDESLTTPEP